MCSRGLRHGAVDWVEQEKSGQSVKRDSTRLQISAITDNDAPYRILRLQDDEHSNCSETYYCLLSYVRADWKTAYSLYHV